jgi:hypothetical protein
VKRAKLVTGWSRRTMRRKANLVARAGQSPTVRCRRQVLLAPRTLHPASSYRIFPTRAALSAADGIFGRDRPLQHRILTAQTPLLAADGIFGRDSRFQGP